MVNNWQQHNKGLNRQYQLTNFMSRQYIESLIIDCATGNMLKKIYHFLSILVRVLQFKK